MATIKDVARACDVCPATVSNVLNNRRAVHPLTRERVMKAAQELNYHPSAIGRGLVHRRMNTVGVVFMHSDANFHLNAYLVAMLEGVLAVAAANKQNTTLCTSYTWATDGDLVPTICDGRTDGVILMTPPLDDHIGTALLKLNVPFVVVGSTMDDPGASTVDVDNTDAARRLVSYLIDIGHQRVALVHFRSELSFSFAQERIAGYRQALKEHNIPSTAEEIVSYTSFDEKPAVGYTSLQQELQELMDRPAGERPTALCCIHDRAAIAVIEALEGMGYSVPGDVSVTGFDDIANVKGFNLTTVRQPFRRIGERAVEILLDQIDAVTAKQPLPVPRREILPAELVLRSTTAPPA